MPSAGNTTAAGGSKDNFEAGETKELLNPVPPGLLSSYWQSRIGSSRLSRFRWSRAENLMKKPEVNSCCWEDVFMDGNAPNCTSAAAGPAAGRADTSLFQQVTGMSCRARVSVVQESSSSKCHPFLFALQTEYFPV